MPAFATVTLDTAAPDIAVSVGFAEDGHPRDVVVDVSTTDLDPTGYEVKLYGDVDDAFAPQDYRALEANAPWVDLADEHPVRLSTGNGLKTVRAKLRDRARNVSLEGTATITLAPRVTIVAGPTPELVGVGATEESSLTWVVDQAFEEYKVKAVATAADPHTAGTVIPTTNGSTNVASAVGGFTANTPTTTTIRGLDLDVATSVDGAHIVKVFARDSAGNWSS